MKYRKILVPTDFSPGSEHALRYACRFAMHTESELVVLHVLDLPTYYYRTLETQMDSPAELKRHAIEQARAKIAESLARNPEAADLRTHIRVRSGSAAQEIRAEVEEEKNVDLLIIATQGRGGIAHALLGSVAEKVIRTCPCPVLTLREGMGGLGTSEFAMRGILCPTDLSKLADSALPTASDLCQRFHAPLHVVHILEDLAAYPMSEWAFLPDSEISAVYEKADQDARASLRKSVEAHCSPAAITFDVSVRRGNAAEGINEEAQRTESDLIVMVTHGRTGFEHAFLGSVAERVARTAPCPVLTIRASNKRGKKEKPVATKDTKPAKSKPAKPAAKEDKKQQKANAKASAKKDKSAAKAAKKDEKKLKSAAKQKQKPKRGK